MSITVIDTGAKFARPSDVEPIRCKLRLDGPAKVVRELRAKLEKIQAEVTVRSVRGVGYRLGPV